MTTASPTGVPAAGELAPDFTLDSTSGSPVTLSSFRGSRNVLIAFFPLAFTSVCTAEMRDFSSDYGRTDVWSGPTWRPRWGSDARMRRSSNRSAR